MDELAVDREARRGHDARHGDGFRIGDLFDIDGDAKLGGCLLDHDFGPLAALAAGAENLDGFHGSVLSEYGVKEKAGGEDPGSDNREEDRDQAVGQNLLQDDHLGQAQRDHRHHEGQRRA